MTPPGLNVKMSQDGGMMFAVMLFGFNLSTTPKLFDFTLVQQTFTTGFTLNSTTVIPLVQCTEQHFAFTEYLKSTYNKLNMNTGLCPPLGQDFTVEGKVSGDIFKVFRVLVDRCNPATDVTCMSDAAFAAT